MTPGLRLLTQVSLPYLRRRFLRMMLAAVSVMLAVALFVATRITDHSLVRSFEQSTEALLGGVQFVVKKGLGADRAVLAAVESVAGVRAAPVVQRNAIAGRLNLTLTVLGIDYTRDAKLRQYKPAGDFDLATLLLNPRAVVIPRALASRAGLSIGDTLTLSAAAGPQQFAVAGIIDDQGPAAAVGGRIVVMPLPAAQKLFAAQGYDRIDVALDPPATLDQLRAALPPGAVAEPASKSNPVLEFSLAQMRTISLAMTLVAVMIGLFIVFNSLALAVVERTGQIGTLRALGARRRDVVILLVCEAVLLSLPASLLGVGLGVLLARELIHQAAANLNILVQLVDVTALVIPFDAWAVAPLLGVATAVGGAVVPARAAARIQPLAALGRTGSVQLQTSRLWKWFLVAIPIEAVSILLVRHPAAPRELAVAGVVGALLAIALAMPQLVLWATAPARALARRLLRFETYLAFDNIAKFPSRTSLTVIAFAGSLAIVVTVGATLHSLEAAVVRWMGVFDAYDLSVQTNPLQESAYTGRSFDASILDQVRADARVADAAGMRNTFLPFRGRTILLFAYDSEVFSRMGVRRGMQQTLPKLPGGTAAVSDNFARIYNLDVGDRVTLDTPGGPRAFSIAHRREDYSWPMGVIFLDRAAFIDAFDDTALTFINVQVKRPEDIDALQTDLTRTLRADVPLYVHRTQHIKDWAIGLTRDWFKLANAQVLIAVVIGAVGVANTLLVSVLSQMRQIGLLRAVGATHGQIQRIIVTEAGLLGVASAVLGVAMGLAAAAFFMPAFLARAAGFAFPLVIPWPSIAFAAAAALVIALAATILPLRALRRFNLLRAITVE